MSWINALLDATSESETPKSFIFWSGLCTISAVVKNNVFLDKFYYKLYPNVYVLLVAKSGLRKTFPVSLAKRLVERVGTTRVIAGRNSIQAILKDLSRPYAAPNSTEFLTDSAGFLNSGEFSNLIIDDPSALTILTDLYDGHYNDTWTNSLKGSGKEALKDISLTMLGATNPSHLKERISQKDIEGGFIARTLVIEETKKGKVNPLLEPPEIMFDPDSLVPYLKELAGVKGQFQLNAEAKETYREWYMEFSENTEREDKTGISNRLHDHILKVAMLLSLAESPGLIITNPQLQLAIDYCLEFSANVTKMTMGGGGTGLKSKQTAIVLQTLLAAPGYKLLRSKFIQKVYGDITSAELDEVITTLVDGKIVLVTRAGADLQFEINPAFIQRMLESKQRKVAK